MVLWPSLLVAQTAWAQLLGSAPTLEFQNVEIDIGEFADGFLGSLFSNIDRIFDPIDPVIDVLSIPVPVLSDLGDEVTLLDLAKLFPDGEGIVRVQVRRGRDGRARVVGVPRELGDEAVLWSAITAEIAHEGPLLVGGHKLTNRLVQALAVDAARDAEKWALYLPRR